MRLLIVGGVAGGASAAARARRLSEDAEIVLFERGPDVSFANCGLPYFVGGTIAERSKLLVTTPERLRERFRLDVRTRTNVESIDRSKKMVRVRDLETGRAYEESYDKLILAPGAAPLRPVLPGVDLPQVHTLRNLQDADRILAGTLAAKSVAVIGAGFIGLELVENFVHRGLNVSLVQVQNQVLSPLDIEMSRPILKEIVSHGVKVFLSDSATSIEPSPAGVVVRLKSGESIEAQFVVMGIGVRPENQLATSAGLETGPQGGIRVDGSMRTSDPDIYAVGDAIEVQDFVLGGPIQIPLAGPANRQGRIAADAIFGKPSTYRGTQGTAIVGVFSKTAAMTGASEKVLRRAGRPFRKVFIHPAHHAGYYPGAEAMTIKLLFAPDDGRILGAQSVGGAGVDKRIDVLAMAIQARMTVFDLEAVELAYAPQYGSAKDPINMLGFVASGLLRGDHPQMAIEDLLAMPTSDRPQLIDVRTATEFAAGHIPGAVNIPVDELRSRMSEIERGRRVAVYCQVGQRGYLATRVLMQRGFEVVNVSGGFRTWEMVSG